MLGLKKMMRLGLVALISAAAWTSAASAAQLTVLSTGAFKQVAVALVPLYESSTGNKIVLDNDTAGGLARRIEAGAVLPSD